MKSALLDQLNWHNLPPKYSLKDGMLTPETGDQTDFWRETLYGFVRDNGHFGFT